MKFVIANDHAAVELKQELKSWLESRGHDVVDLGVGEGERADYPDKGREAAVEFLKGGYDHGIVCCGTGIGISISANKVQGIRCGLPQNVYAAVMAKEHNDCQMIAFGARIDYPESPVAMLEAYLDAEHDPSSRHAGRVKKIMGIESI